MSSARPKLPDDALTVFAQAGLGGLDAYAEKGLIERGVYECPVCEGVDWNGGVLGGCTTCDGDGVVVVPGSHAWRGYGGAWREHRRVALLKRRSKDAL